MDNINLFKLNSTFETLNGGTLSYPNTSFIEETQLLSIRQTPPPHEITFYIYGYPHKALSGMTWEEWCVYGVWEDNGCYSKYPGYNDGSTEMDDRRPGCDMSWIVTTDNRIGTDTYSTLATHWVCISTGWVYIKDVLPNDIIEPGRNYKIDE